MIGRVLTSICLVTLLAFEVAAQPPVQAPSRAERNGIDTPADTVGAAELVSMMDTYAIVEAERALALTDDQYGQFVTRLKRLQQGRRRNQRARNQIIQSLQKLSGPRAGADPDEAAIRERLQALKAHDERAALEMRRAYDAVDDLLTPRQQARFRVFEVAIERKKLDLLMRARERAGRRK